MPITFNETSNSFEGGNDFDTTLAGFDFSVFGGIISNSGAITAPVTARSDQGIEFVNSLFGSLSKAAGSQYALDLTGNGGRLIFNDGTIFGSVRLGNGFDNFFNSGLVEGQIRTGNGNDTLTNQILPGIDGGPQTVGTITGTVNMGNGDDAVLNTGVMADILLGDGNDTYTVSGFFGVASDNATSGISGDVRGGSGDDTMTGGASDENFYGGGDNDLLIGNGGRDQLKGQSGDDLIFGGDGNDNIIGGSGNDFIDGGNNNDRLSGGTGNDVIVAGSGNDQLFGGADDDFLSGDNGNDFMNGGSGNDTLEGGQGRDILIGGDGDDVFVFRGRTNTDEIRDFNEGDRIDLQALAGAGSITFADVLDNTVFAGGDAIIDLSTLFNNANFDGPVDRGSVLTVNNVTAADLDASAFILSEDIFIAV
ncbi:calcium-binding protein [Sulfitobacter guttiformis]|uniref:Putative secreted protein (Type I secretion substrate) n=1 Tax=Sulfitobacter guttiformis TaxID=74349 RepID=A0A420DIW7_9RHOB|nr:calcium-binding protein [Sulfitobacter guttiformis]KIN72059.1 Hemolysin-type calcium-binding repeat family protein [Sulfitobacter guttiformis KCTC 32187]RKE94161.1 putative secreted protein (type I secretion substrate) [Sulfitobacter guttiformis]